MKISGARQRSRWLERLALGGAVVGMLVGVLVWILCPFPQDKLERYPASTAILDRAGRPLRWMGKETETLCVPVRLEESGPWLAKAFIAAEDKRFYWHCGVDVLALFRALGQNLCARRVVSGASTISTQVVRLVEPRRRTFRSKIIEVFRVLQLEQRLSKEQILEQYLNRAPFGAHLVGVEAASRRYCGKSVGALSLAEAALLAGLPQAPSRLRPDRFPRRAAARRDYVLRRMFECGFINREQWRSARSEPVISLTSAPLRCAPAVCDRGAARPPDSPGRHPTSSTGVGDGAPARRRGGVAAEVGFDAVDQPLQGDRLGEEQVTAALQAFRAGFPRRHRCGQQYDRDVA